MFSVAPNLILQRLSSPVLDEGMRVISLAGTQWFYLLLLPCLYWCWRRRDALRLTWLFLGCALLNGLLKAALDLPRPFEVDLRVLALSTETSPGFPSGHVMCSMALFGGLAVLIRTRRAYLLGGLAVLLISLSRIYLGVHFLVDVAGGLILGLPFVWAARRLERWTEPLMTTPMLLAATGLPALILPPLFPYPQSGMITGAALGLALGGLLERRRVRHEIQGSVLTRLIRGGIGLAVTLPILLAPQILLPRGTYWRVLRYAMVTAFAIGVVPALLHELGIGSVREEPGLDEPQEP